MMPKNKAPTLDEILHLFLLPNQYQEISRLVYNSQVSSAEIARFIATRPQLTERLLSLINSTLYKHQSTIYTIERGIAVVGSEEILYLILLLSVIDLFEQKLDSRLDLSDFWSDCVYCGLMARFLAKRNGGLHSDSLFSIGFLRNMGSLVISQLMHELALHIGAEQALKALDFASVGAELLRLWQLPSAIYQPVEYQLMPEWGGMHHVDAKMIHIAALLCEISADSKVSSEFLWRAIPLEYRAILNMDKETLFAVFKQVRNDRQEVFELLVQDSSFVAF